MSEENQDDPRVRLSRHKERSYARYTYTIMDLARLTGYSYDTLKHYSSGPDPRLRLNDLGSVFEFIASCKQLQPPPIAPELPYLLKRQEMKRAKPISDETFIQDPFFEDHRDLYKSWPGRWPLFNFYRCAKRDCTKYVLGAPGLLCEEHSCAWAPIRVDRYFEVLIEHRKYVPIHKLMRPIPDSTTKFLDGNLLNNRLLNLEHRPRGPDNEKEGYASTDGIGSEDTK